MKIQNTLYFVQLSQIINCWLNQKRQLQFIYWRIPTWNVLEKTKPTDRTNQCAFVYYQLHYSLNSSELIEIIFPLNFN